MDIAGVSGALAQVRLETKVSTAMLGKTMDANESMGAGLLKMIDSAAMENSVAPWLGSNFDMKV